MLPSVTVFEGVTNLENYSAEDISTIQLDRSKYKANFSLSELGTAQPQLVYVQIVNFVFDVLQDLLKIQTSGRASKQTFCMSGGTSKLFIEVRAWTWGLGDPECLLQNNI